jgi:hypothetical protein
MNRLFYVVVASGLACKYPALPSLTANDASGGPSDSGSGEQGSGEPATWTFVPLHLEASQLPATVHDLTLSSVTTIDTSALTINGSKSSSLVQVGSYAVLFAGAFSAEADLTVTGSLPLIVSATKTLRVDGNIVAAATGPIPGAGAASTGAGTSGTLFFIVQSGSDETSGGGGGSYEMAGGGGGTQDTTNDPGGVGGPVYAGSASSSPLIGGSPGGAGGNTTGRGGGGGGAVQLTSEIEVFVGGIEINVCGGGGGGGGIGAYAGDGGGAGGEVILEAPMIADEGFIAANGGGGGGGGGTTAGSNGADGTVSYNPALGGTRGSGGGGFGGDGGAGSTSGGPEFPQAGENGPYGGGGGGAVGVIWLRYEAATPPNLTGAHFAPNANNDSTLP